MIPPEVYDRTLRGLMQPILPWLDDPAVTEVMINGPGEIFVETGGRISKCHAGFASSQKLLSALRLVAQYVGRPFDEAHPILEARLPDGSRLQALLPPIAPDGPAVAIRRFSKERLTLARLIGFGALTQDAALTLHALVACKRNIVVAGGTGSGKTSLLNALSAFVPDGERIVVIEDARELQLQREHVVHLEARPADARGRGAISIRDLFKATLRMRPDRIVIGEVRSGEALDLVQAMTSGHGGCLTSVHASYPLDTLNRLETLALMGGVDLPLAALRAQIASAVDIVVQTGRLRDGRRVVTHISEVCGADPHGYQLKDIFIGTTSCSHDNRAIRFKLEPTGALPDCLPLLRSQGWELPKSVIERTRMPGPMHDVGAQRHS